MLRQVQRVLKHYYGYDSLRPGQDEVITSLLSGRDTVAIMPTGAGKSLCFQLPALLLPGVTIVITPLISLMKDQVDSLEGQGIAATYINSSLSAQETGNRLYHMRNGHYRLLYVAPERLENEAFQQLLTDMPVSLVAVDEAHCVSQWGHDFRPSYRYIAPFIAGLASRPVVGAFTATATPEVKADICRLLDLQNACVYVTGFDRPNLRFTVLRGEDKERYVINYARINASQAGIIYAATRKDVDALYDSLNRAGIQAGRYHAGLSDEERRHWQEAFLYDRVRVMAATNAFGMGIDKSNVRFVIHYHMPKNMEAYYQEAGRSGRDGEPGDCMLLYGPQDVMLQKFLIEKSVEDPRRKQHELQKLRQMVEYVHLSGCLRSFILRYFGESGAPGECGNCGNCCDDGEKTDITEDACKVFSCISHMKERFGLSLVAEVLKGSRSKKVRQYGFESLPTFGVMAGHSLPDIRTIIQRLAASDYLCLTDGLYPVVRLAPQARAVLGSQARVWQKTAAVRSRAENDDTLFETLRQLRRRLAEEAGVPPFVVFADSVLWELCRQQPVTVEDLRRIKGIGEVKLERYGPAFLAAIRSHASP